MVRCAIATCQFVGTSTHNFPKNENRREKWVNFVRLIEPKFVPNTHTVICGGHFDQSCFNRNFPMEQKFGYYSKRRNLRDDAVPTILYPKSSETYAPKDPRRILPKPVVGSDIVCQIPILLVPESHEAVQKNLSPAVLLTADSGNTQASHAQSNENKNYKDIMTYTKPNRGISNIQILQNTSEVIVEKHQTFFTFQEIERMMPLNLVKFFASEVKIKDSNAKAMRCRMLPAYLCPFVISCPTLEECASVMKLHLKRHVKSCMYGTEKDPQFFANMMFQSVLGEEPDDNCSPELLADIATDIDVSSTDQEAAIETKNNANSSNSSGQTECDKTFPSTSGATGQIVPGVTELEKTRSSLSHSVQTRNLMPMGGISKKKSCSSGVKIPQHPQNKNSFTTVLPCSTALNKVFQHTRKMNISPQTFSNAMLNQVSDAGFIKFDEFFNKSPRKYLLAPSRTPVTSQNASEPALSLVLHPLVNLVNPKIPIPSLRQPIEAELDVPVITKITGSAVPIEENAMHSAPLVEGNLLHSAFVGEGKSLPSTRQRKKEKLVRLIEKVDASTQVEPSGGSPRFTTSGIKMDQLHDRLYGERCSTSPLSVHSQKTSATSGIDSGEVTPEPGSVPSLADLANEALCTDLRKSPLIGKNPCGISDTDLLLSSIEEDFNFLSYSGVECDEMSFVKDLVNLPTSEVNLGRTSDTGERSMPQSDDPNHMKGRNTVNIKNRSFDTNLIQIEERTCSSNHDSDQTEEQSRKKTALLGEKESFLNVLGLQRTTVMTPSLEINSNFFPVPIPKFRTRAQKKTALFERFFLKRKAELLPKELRVHLQPIAPKTLKKDNKENAKNRIVSRNLRRHSQSMQKFYLSRLEQSSKSALSCEYKDIKGYNLRRANRLKKRAHDQVKQPPLSQKTVSQSLKELEKNDVPYTAVGEVIRMPVDGLIELYEEERKFTRECNEEQEKIRLVEEEMQRIKRQEEGKMMREEEINNEEIEWSEPEDLTKLKDQKIPENKVVLRRIKLPEHLRPPGKGPRKIMPITNEHFVFAKKKKASQPLEIEVNGEIIQIKNEPLTSDEDDLAFDEESPVLSSDDELWNNYRPTLTVSNLLFNKRKKKRSHEVYGASESSETEDSEDEHQIERVDKYVMEEVDEQAVFSGNESEEELVVVDDDEIVKQELTPKVPVEKVLELTKEAENIGAPSLSEAEIEVLAFYNDHPYSYVHGERNRKMISRLAGPVCDGLASSALLPSLVTETEYKVREKALEYLRILKEGENQQQNVAVTDGNIPDNLTCMICSKKFTATNSMYYHYRSHAGVKPFKCEVCNKSFTRLHSLNYHMMIHENKTRFKCKYCNRGFRHPTHYKEHLNKHTGQEPFFCSICDRRFKTSNSQRRHMRSKHNLRLIESVNQINALSSQVAPSAIGVDISSSSPPLPDSPSPPALPMKPFSFPQSKSVKLVLFPKNGMSRVSYSGE